MGNKRKKTGSAGAKAKKPCYSENACDLTLQVEGKPIPVIRALLIMKSPVFAAMLTGEFVEKNQTSIELPGKNHKEMLEFMEFVHMFERKELTDDNITYIYWLSHEYDVDSIHQQCLQFLNNMPFDSTSTLKIADKCDQEGLVKEIVKASEPAKLYTFLTEIEESDLKNVYTYKQLLLGVKPYLNFAANFEYYFDISIDTTTLMNPTVLFPDPRFARQDMLRACVMCKGMKITTTKARVINCKDCYEKVRRVAEYLWDEDSEDEEDEEG